MAQGSSSEVISAILSARMNMFSGPSALPDAASVVRLTEHCEEILAGEPSLLQLSGPIVVVGDLHGNIDDLLRIFKRCGYPPDTRYLFLGDYVDRGSYSVEVMTLLVALKVRFPQSLYLVRGNHECCTMCSFFGFRAECLMKYGESVYECFVRLFTFLPFAAVLNGTVFCCHGGISPDIQKVGQVTELNRPSRSFESAVSDGIVWSDPKPDSDGWSENDRGAGWFFNQAKLQEFLDANGLTLLVRAHEYCADGYLWPFGESGGCVTVFSSSDYCDMWNAAAVAKFGDDDHCTFETFAPLTHGDRLNRRVIVPPWLLEEPILKKPKDAIEFDDWLNVICEDPINWLL